MEIVFQDIRWKSKVEEIIKEIKKLRKTIEKLYKPEYRIKSPR